MTYKINDRVIVRVSAHTLIEGRVAEIARIYGHETLRIEPVMVGVDIIVRGDVVDSIVYPAPRDVEPEPGAPESLEARLMAGAVWGIMRARLDESGRQISDDRVATGDGYVWAFVAQDDAKREAAGLSKRYGRAGGKREYRYSVTPFTLEEAAAASDHGYALNGNHPDAPVETEGTK